MEDKQVYWDDELKMLYWIEWEETGNNDIPHRHYINILVEKFCKEQSASVNTSNQNFYDNPVLKCPFCNGKLRFFRQMYLRTMYWYAECETNVSHYRWPSKHGFSTKEELIDKLTLILY